MSFIQYLEDCYDDDEFMDEKILEALQNNTFQHLEERITSHDMQHGNQQEFTYENLVTSPEIDVEMQQTCKSFDHKEDENHCKQQGEILEDCFYNPQAEKNVDYLCHTL